MTTVFVEQPLGKTVGLLEQIKTNVSTMVCVLCVTLNHFNCSRPHPFRKGVQSKVQFFSSCHLCSHITDYLGSLCAPLMRVQGTTIK